MIFKVIPQRQGNEFYDAIISYNDKFLNDEVEKLMEYCRANHTDSADRELGPFSIRLRPRRRGFKVFTERE